MSVLSSWVYSTTTVRPRDRVYEILCCSLLLIACRKKHRGDALLQQKKTHLLFNLINDEVRQDRHRKCVDV